MSDALPPSLTDPALAPLWAEVSDRLARNGLDWRGRIRPPDLPPSARLTVESLTGAKGRTTIDLTALEAGLLAAGVGEDLPQSLARLGHPVSTVHAERRAARAAAAAARNAARERAATWPEPWAGPWFEELVRAGLFAGLDEAAAARLVDDVRAVLDALDTGAAAGADPDGDVGEGAAGPVAAPTSRVELAARVLGSAHALDRGTRLERATARALAARRSVEQAEAAAKLDDRSLWAEAGAVPDLLSGAVVTWNLKLAEDHQLAPVVRRSKALGIPFVFTQLALGRYPVRVPAGAEVLVVENPRVLERAVQERVPIAMVCGNGNPTTTVRLLLGQLLAAGARVRYHGDFDAAGLAITARMHALGLEPWRMAVGDYLDAIAASAAEGVDLPTDPADASPTPWAPTLAEVFNERHLVVHEERVLDDLLHL